MIAVVIPRHGGAEVLEYVKDFPDPVPKADEVVVRVAATTVNQMDLLVRNGYPNSAIPLPHVPGGDVVGTVEAIGSSVSSVTVGRRVLVYPLLSCGTCSNCRSGKRNLCANWQTVGIHHHGGYAQRVAVPAANVIPLPDELDFRHAASVPIAGMTAHHALSTVGRLKEGEVCLVWGAAGGLGSAAIQIARHLGAKVVAVVGTPEKKAFVEAAGYDLIVDRSSEAVADAVRTRFPDGVDAVLDTIGSSTYATSLSLLKNGGRLLSCGILGGREVPLNIHMVYYHHLTIHGLFLGTVDDMRSAIDLAGRGILNPPIDRVLKLREAVEGQRVLEQGEQMGKIVIEIEE